MTKVLPLTLGRLGVAMLAVSACNSGDMVSPGTEGWPCPNDNNCLGELRCINGACAVVAPPNDAGPAVDAGPIDAGPDGGMVDAGDGGLNDGGNPCPNPATFTYVQAQIFGPNGQAHCNQAACHGAAAAGGLSLLGPAAMLRQALLGPTQTVGAPEAFLVVPGSPETSRLYVVMRDRNPVGQGDPMPPAAPVPFCDLEAVRQWIAAGALDN